MKINYLPSGSKSRFASLISCWLPLESLFFCAASQGRSRGAPVQASWCSSASGGRASLNLGSAASSMVSSLRLRLKSGRTFVHQFLPRRKILEVVEVNWAQLGRERVHVGVHPQVVEVKMLTSPACERPWAMESPVRVVHCLLLEHSSHPRVHWFVHKPRVDLPWALVGVHKAQVDHLLGPSSSRIRLSFRSRWEVRWVFSIALGDVHNYVVASHVFIVFWNFWGVRIRIFWKWGLCKFLKIELKSLPPRQRRQWTSKGGK